MNVGLDLKGPLAKVLQENESILHVRHLLAELLLLQDCFRLVNELSFHNLLTVDVVIIGVRVVNSLTVVLLLLRTDQISSNSRPTVLNQYVDLPQQQVVIVTLDQIEQLLLNCRTTTHQTSYSHHQNSSTHLDRKL